MSIREMFTEDANRTYALVAVFIFCIVALIIAAWTGGFQGFSQTLVAVVALVAGPIGYFFGTANLVKQTQESLKLLNTLTSRSTELIVKTMSRMWGVKPTNPEEPDKEPEGNTTYVDTDITGTGEEGEDGPSDGS